MSNWSTTDKHPSYSFERKSDESGTSFLFGKNKTKQYSFERKSDESGTSFLFGKNRTKQYSFGNFSIKD